MTPQEIFDKVVEHAKGMKERSMSSDPADPTSCAYRSKTGNRCFVGVLIPDELYSPNMEGCGITGLVAYYRNSLPPWMKSNVGMLYCLQDTHDNTARKEWKEYLQHIATQYKLNDSVLTGMSDTWAPAEAG